MWDRLQGREPTGEAGRGRGWGHGCGNTGYEKTGVKKEGGKIDGSEGGVIEEIGQKGGESGGWRRNG